MKISRRNILIHLCMTVSLLALWIVLIYLHIYLQKGGFFTLRYPHFQTFTNSEFNKKLLKGQQFNGQFAARENYLGIVSLRFETFDRINTDKLIFKLREKGGDKWYYQGLYKTQIFQSSKYFTFGFPKITNSKGKTYEFTIISLNGKSDDAVAVENSPPALVSRYEIPRRLMLRSPSTLLAFLKEKFLLAIVDPDYFFAFILYLFPLVFYILWVLFLKRSYSKHERQIKGLYKMTAKYSPLFLVVIGLIIDLLLVKATYDPIIFTILGLFILVARLYKIETTMVFYATVPLFIGTALLTVSGNETAAGKFALWGYILLWYCCIRLLNHSFFHPKHEN